jgi:hypothetical protein
MKILITILVALLRVPVVGGALEWLLTRLRRFSAEAMKRARRDNVRPRNWSNAELRKFARLYDGPVINVSGWKDEDQAGGHYRDYFSAATAYTVSNFAGTKGAQGREAEVFIDLEGAASAALAEKYQVVFNHTTLEHVYDIKTALANLCALSNDTVILVTPFLQQVHFEDGSFGDFWRPTPQCLTRMLAENGFETVYQSANDNEWYIVYVFTIASRFPARYAQQIPREYPAKFLGSKHFGLD